MNEHLDGIANSQERNITSESVMQILDKYRMSKVSLRDVNENIQDISACVMRIIEERREEIVLAAVRTVVLGK